MFSEQIDSDDLEIHIHHIGGIGGYGPSEVLDHLGHVQWVIYDALEDSISESDTVQQGRQLFINHCIGESEYHSVFNVMESSDASSLFEPAPSASDYTYIMKNGEARVWGSHCKVVKTIEVDISTLDNLVRKQEVPQIDFVSIDAQGAELAILKGGREAIAANAIGIVCEVEFSPIYQKQPLFGEIQAHLNENDFRLCEIYSAQYFNTKWLPLELLGKGFLTVGEALFLRENLIIEGNDPGDARFSSELKSVIQTLKLAAVSVAFNQLDYAVTLCEQLEKHNLVSLEIVAKRTGVRYVEMLRDVMYEARAIIDNGEYPILEDLTRTNQTMASKPLPLPVKRTLREAMRLIIPPIFLQWKRQIRRSDSLERTSQPRIVEILGEYGMNIKQLKQRKRTFADVNRR